MAVFSYCIAWAYERDRLYEPCKQLWWRRQCKERGTSMYFSKGLSAVHVNISFKHTSTRVVRIGWIKDGNYIYFIAQTDLHFGELVISIRNYR